MIDERKLTRYIKTEINPYGKPFDGTVFEFGNMLIDYMERMEKEPERNWIPVSERLPEERQDRYYPISLVTLDNGDVCLGVYRYDDKEWWTRMSEGETVYTTDHKVIAWQPLPEPYKESEEE